MAPDSNIVRSLSVITGTLLVGLSARDWALGRAPRQLAFRVVEHPHHVPFGGDRPRVSERSAPEVAFHHGRSGVWRVHGLEASMGDERGPARCTYADEICRRSAPSHASGRRTDGWLARISFSILSGQAALATKRRFAKP